MMKIVELRAENFMRLKAVQIKMEDGVLKIRGKNGAGKSSVLDIITATLCGGKALPEKPIREGADKGFTYVETDEGLKITRKFTPKGTYLQIEAADGSIQKSPQALLDEIVGNISFDPLAFMNQKAAAQRETLMELVGLDLTTIDESIGELRESRTEIGREVKSYTGHLGGLTFTPDIPKKEISVADLSQSLQEAHKHNQEGIDLKHAIENEEGAIAHTKVKIIDCQVEIEELQTKLERLKSSQETSKPLMEDWNKRLESFNPVDTDAIQSEIAGAEVTNAQIRENVQFAEVKVALARETAEYDDATKNIADLEEQKEKDLKDAKMPIEGLAVTSGGVAYNGIPISQISSSEKLRVGLAISMALNPKLRTLRISDGSLLDEDNLKQIEKMVGDKDYNLLIEIVGGDGASGIIIEDGEVVE